MMVLPNGWSQTLLLYDAHFLYCFGSVFMTTTGDACADTKKKQEKTQGSYSFWLKLDKYFSLQKQYFSLQKLFLISYILLFNLGSLTGAPKMGGTAAPLASGLVPHVPIVTSSSLAVG